MVAESPYVTPSPWSRSATDLEARLTRRLARRVAEGQETNDSGLPAGPATPPVAQMLAFLFMLGPFLEEGKARFGSHLTLRMPGLPPLVQFSDPAAVRTIFADDGDGMGVDAILSSGTTACDLMPRRLARERAAV